MPNAAALRIVIQGALACWLTAMAAFAQDVQVNPVDTNLPNQDNSTAQSETSHAEFGSTVVVAYNDSQQTTSLGAAFTSLMSYSSSANGGATWTYGGLATAPAGQRLWGDPMVVVDGSGVFYMASLSGPAGVGNGIGGVAVYQSTGNSPSVTFGTPVLVNGISGTSAGGQDKEWLAVDTTGGAFNGRVYLAWTDFVTLSTGQIEFVRSTSTSPLTLTAPVAIGPADKLNHGANLAVGPAGELYLAW
ncbi:MAG TPA: hypothetical protein VKY89_17145, partial [Thermoanaerobaculia bacterium]|nr:hypothetical protein [Thermoanaerobaculia bacterium]